MSENEEKGIIDAIDLTAKDDFISFQIQYVPLHKSPTGEPVESDSPVTGPTYACNVAQCQMLVDVLSEAIRKAKTGEPFSIGNPIH